MSVYDAIGGQRSVRTVVDVFYRRVTGDPKLMPFFEGIDLAGLAAHQRAFLSAALGGPDMYGGRDLATAHAGMRIDDAAFDLLTDHLTATLRDLGADHDTVLDVSERIEAYRGKIVESDPPSS